MTDNPTPATTAGDGGHHRLGQSVDDMIPIAVRAGLHAIVIGPPHIGKTAVMRDLLRHLPPEPPTVPDPPTTTT